MRYSLSLGTSSVVSRIALRASTLVGSSRLLDPARAMSCENVEVVRRYYAGSNQRDWSLLPELVDPDIELDLSRNILTPTSFKANAGLRRFASVVDDMWDEFSAVSIDLIDAGDNVVAAVTMGGRSKRSGVDVTMQIFNVFTLRDSKVLRIVGGYRERSEALEAVGLSE